MRTLLLAVFIAGALTAADHPARIVVNPATDNVVAQVVDGGDGWTTTFFLTNLDPVKTINWQIVFYDDNGFPMALPITGLIGQTANLFAALPPDWSVTIQTQGTSFSLRQGWASILTYDRPANQPGATVVPDRIGGLAVFRQRIAGRPDFEAVVPISPATENRFVMPFDNRAGYSTGVALLNPSSQGPAQLQVVIRAEDGALIAIDGFILQAGNKVVFSMPQRYPQTIGRNGRMAVSTSAPMLSGLGLRFNPTGAFTSFHTLSAP